MSIKWYENKDKDLKILQAIRKSAKKISKVISMDRIRDILDKLLEMKPVDRYINSRYSTAIYPIEEIRSYRMYEELPSYGQLLDELTRYDYSLASIDSSSHDLGVHGYIPFRVHNIGLWYINYGKNYGGEDNIVFIGEQSDYQEMGERVWMKYNEGDAVKRIIEYMDGSTEVLMFDESFSIGFTMSWASDERRLYMDAMTKYIQYCIDHDVIPVGIYYTRSVDIMRGMIDLGLISEGEYDLIPDKIIIDQLLDVGERSPLFKVYSYPLQDSGLELNVFYIKTDDKSIMRIEYPSLIDSIDDIYRAVLLTSIIGGGYPYPLHGSHQNAILTWDLREAINETICEIIGIPIEVFFSRKEESKRWPIV